MCCNVSATPSLTRLCVKSMVDKDVSWAAGLFEGEGSIVVRDSRGSIQITVYNTDEDVIRSFHGVMKVGSVKGPRSTRTPRGLPAKDMWEWHAYSTNARHVLERLLPYLCARRLARATRALAVKSRSISRDDMNARQRILDRRRVKDRERKRQKRKPKT